MINGKTVLAMIPARGGSKGIKNKNIIDVCGKPLIAYTIEAAKSSKYIDCVFVSTDSEKIRDVSLECGAEVPFLRDEECARDTSTTLDAIRNSLGKLSAAGQNYDIMILLQPTSPLRTVADIDGAIEKFAKYSCSSLVSVSEVNDSPILMRRVLSDDSMEKILPSDSTVRRQDMPKYYRVNGSIYINMTEEINGNTSFNDNEIPFIVPKEHAVDVDGYEDLELVKYYITSEKNRK